MEKKLEPSFLTTREIRMYLQELDFEEKKAEKVFPL